MKTLLTLLITSLLMTSGCNDTGYGGNACIGINDDEQPHLKYKYDTWNIVMGVLFIKTLVVPIVVVLDEVKCPIGPK